MNASAPRTSQRSLVERAIVRRIGACAIRSLHAELVLYPKPGLVSLHDSGAHDDMDAATLMRSVIALRSYFPEIARAGVQTKSFAELRRLGVAAEMRMLCATGGVNTHRGAIFAVGLLAAAAGRILAASQQVTDAAFRATILGWRHALAVELVDANVGPSHGRWVASRYGAEGARGEALAGFPSVFTVGLPALRSALGRGSAVSAAHVHAFFALLAQVEDTNVLYRGGADSLAWIRDEARKFLRSGSVFAENWLQHAESIHRRCCERRLSPGGCADLFSASWFVYQLQSHV